jgi:hypothetical protein
LAGAGIMHGRSPTHEHGHAAALEQRRHAGT